MSIVIMKFGGTSVATTEGRQAICNRVCAQIEQGKSPVVVVSAMGRKGAPYATDTLLELVAGLPVSDREHDQLASVGEIVSAVLVAHELRAAGVNAAAYTGPQAGIITDNRAKNASITEIYTAPLVSALDEAIVPVVCGFQGMSLEGHLTTLGRGGSDTTACALGVALDAECVEIYSDVDGVMTADPRVVEDARVLEVIRADELYQMAKFGSKVVHVPAAELALSSGVSLYVKNTYTDHPGSRVADISSYRPSASVTAIASTRDITRFVVDLGGSEGSKTHMIAQTSVYEAIAAQKISLDMFTPDDRRLTFTVASGATKEVAKALAKLGLGFVEMTHLAKVTVVGAGMHGVPGVMAKISRALLDANIDIYQSADSSTTISVLVDDKHADDATRALHYAFYLGSDS